MPITEEQLKEWEEIEKRATQGPWMNAKRNGAPYKTGAVKRVLDDNNYQIIAQAFNTTDGTFCAVARTALPLLIEEVRSLRVMLNSLIRSQTTHRR